LHRAIIAADWPSAQGLGVALAISHLHSLTGRDVHDTEAVQNGVLGSSLKGCNKMSVLLHSAESGQSFYMRYTHRQKLGQQRNVTFGIENTGSRGHRLSLARISIWQRASTEACT